MIGVVAMDRIILPKSLGHRIPSFLFHDFISGFFFSLQEILLVDILGWDVMDKNTWFRGKLQARKYQDLATTSFQNMMFAHASKTQISNLKALP